MGFYSLHAYDADVYIPGFLGLKQQDVLLNPDTRFAAEAYSVETKNGVLQPTCSTPIYYTYYTPRVTFETFALFHRRNYTGYGSKDWIIAAGGGKLYSRRADYGMWTSALPMPTGISSFQSNVWSWVTYEINPSDTTLDVLLISNKEDGMFMVIPPDSENMWSTVKTHNWTYEKNLTWEQVKSPTWAIQPVDTRANPEDEDEEPAKFGVIERYAERIWGGDIAGHPDQLRYSRAYDPTDWTPDTDIPEDGAGEINVPTWDGDSFTALKRFGDQLLAFKKKGIWRILGTNPGEYEVREQFGEGTPNAKTVAVYGERVFFVGDNGLYVYDGQTTAPYLQENIENIWRRVNLKAIEKMRSAILNDKYYLAVPMDKYDKCCNAFLIYNLEEGTVLFQGNRDNIISENISVNDLLQMEDKLYNNGRILLGACNVGNGTHQEFYDDTWNRKSADVSGGGKWVSPWMDLGRKDIQKGGFDLYFTPEVKDHAVTFRISIQTEKKTKTKEYTVQPISVTGKEHKEKKLHFGGTGRKFRVIIESSGSYPWRIVGGIHLIVEIDPD